MNRLSLSLAMLLTLACNRMDIIETEEQLDPNQLISIVVSTTSSRGAMVSEAGEMGTMGIYCAYTGGTGWYEGADFKKLDNSLYNIASNGDCTIDDTPVPWDYESISDKYTFFGYSPHSSVSDAISTRIDGGELFIDYTVPASSLEQPDLMISYPQKDIMPQISKGVSLNFIHTLAAVSFAVNTTTDITITAITIKGANDAGTLNWDYDNDTTYWNLTGSTEKVFSVDIGEYTLDETNTAQVTSDEGYLMMIPQTLDNGAQVTLELSNNTSQELTIPAKTVWLAGGHYHYTIALEDNDFIFSSSQVSNCYIINPVAGEPTIVQIPIEDRINDFWKNYSESGNKKITSDSQCNEFSIVTVWEDFETAVVFDEDNLPTVIDDGTGSMAALFIFDEKYQDGNYVFAVRDSDNDVLWSWHLWFTAYNPDAIADANRSKITSTQYEYSLDDYTGAVHRYPDSGGTVWSGIYDGKFIMDRNIGERTTYTSATDPGGVYYQFGRKDPFPSSDNPYNTADFYRLYANATGYTFQAAVEAPHTFIFSNSSDANWCGNLVARTPNTYIWYDEKQTVSGYSTGKSIFDPSPLGWRVPLNDVWSSFNGKISDCDKTSDIINIYQSYRPYGYRDSSSSTELTDTEVNAYAWGATTTTDRNGYYLNIGGDDMQLGCEFYLSDALPVRAIEE